MDVLVIEDDEKVSSHLQWGLKESGFSADIANSIASAFSLLDLKHFDVLIVDRGLPDGDGLELVRTLRLSDKETPVIFLTAHDQVDDRIEGLEAGSDDYVVKPFAFSELLARIRALLRRAASGDSLLLKMEDLEVDLVARHVKRAGEIIHIRPREYDLFVFLLRNAGQPVSREAIARNVWGIESPAVPMDNVIDVHISHLREHIDRGREERLLKTLRGVGFMLGKERL